MCTIAQKQKMTFIEYLFYFTHKIHIQTFKRSKQPIPSPLVCLTIHQYFQLSHLPFWEVARKLPLLRFEASILRPNLILTPSPYLPMKLFVQAFSLLS